MTLPPNDQSKLAAHSLPKPTHLDETRWEKIAQNLKTIGGAVLLALVIRTCLFEAFEIEGPSMEPTLLNGDRVVVAKFIYGLFLPFRDHADLTWGAPDVGNVVIIKSPADGVDIVKRVIGVAGDTIEVDDDAVYRNGVALPRERLGHCETGTGSSSVRCHWYRSKVGDHEFLTSSSHVYPHERTTVHIPEGYIYVLGDHRDSSNDSRNPALGAIPVSNVKGRALSIYWSSGDDGLRWSRMLHNVQ